VSGRDLRSSGTATEGEQLGEAERSVATRTRVRRLAALIAADERLDDDPAKLLAEVKGDVREAAAVARTASGADGVR
jgi:hypothetical protein